MMNKSLDWYLKWIATAILIVGTLFNSLGYYPLGPILLIVGGLIWFVVAILWKEISLIIVNGIMSLTGIGALVYNMLSL